MLKIRADVEKWALSPTTIEEKMSLLDADPELALKVRVLYSVFTELGIAFDHGMIHKKMVCNIYNPIVPQAWDMLEPYILYQRKKGILIGYSFLKLRNLIVEHQKKKWTKRTDQFNLMIENKSNVN